MRTVFAALYTVFRKAGYGVFAVAVSCGFLLTALFVQNANLLVFVYESSRSMQEALQLLASLTLPILSSIVTVTFFSSAVLAVLLGVDVAMITYFLAHRIRDMRASGMATGALGVVSGLLGIGCAACGSFLLTSSLAVFGAVGALAYLPLHGFEFMLLAIALVSLSIYLTAGQIQNPLVCRSY